MADTQVRVLAERLLSCLCDAVSGNPNPPASCCYRVEFEPPHDLGPFTDLCCEGLAYVTFGDVWPSSASFPENDIVRQANTSCAPPAWAIQLKAGIMRCAPTGTDVAPPTCDEETAAFLQDLDDSQALRAASCCFRSFMNTDPVWIGMSVVVERQTKTVQGGCTDRSIIINAQMMNCESCS